MTQAASPPAPLSVLLALVKAQHAVQAAAKDGHNPEEGWSYPTISRVLTVAKAALDANGLGVVPLGSPFLQVTADGWTFQTRTWCVVNTVTGDTWCTSTAWPIDDDESKAADKLWAALDSYGIKYFLRDLLLIPFGECRDDQSRPRPSSAPASSSPPAPTRRMARPRSVTEEVKRDASDVPEGSVVVRKPSKSEREGLTAIGSLSRAAVSVELGDEQREKEATQDAKAKALMETETRPQLRDPPGLMEDGPPASGTPFRDNGVQSFRRSEVEPSVKMLSPWGPQSGSVTVSTALYDPPPNPRVCEKAGCGREHWVGDGPCEPFNTPQRGEEGSLPSSTPPVGSAPLGPQQKPASPPGEGHPGNGEQQRLASSATPKDEQDSEAAAAFESTNALCIPAEQECEHERAGIIRMWCYEFHGGPPPGADNGLSSSPVVTPTKRDPSACNCTHGAEYHGATGCRECRRHDVSPCPWTGAPKCDACGKALVPDLEEEGMLVCPDETCRDNDWREMVAADQGPITQPTKEQAYAVGVAADAVAWKDRGARWACRPLTVSPMKPAGKCAECGEQVRAGDPFHKGRPKPSDVDVDQKLSRQGKPYGVCHEKCVKAMAEARDPRAATKGGESHG